MLELYKKLLAVLSSQGPWLSAALFVGVTLLGTVAALAAIVWLPADHFCDGRTAARLRQNHPVVRLALIAVKNLVGLLLLPLGVLMALPLVPGPGVVFILLGLSLIDFPGKRGLERRLLRVPSVHRFIDRVRSHYARPPLELD